MALPFLFVQRVELFLQGVVARADHWLLPAVLDSAYGSAGCCRFLAELGIVGAVG
jgi:hypothetical protein